MPEALLVWTGPNERCGAGEQHARMCRGGLRDTLDTHDPGLDQLVGVGPMDLRAGRADDRGKVGPSDSGLYWALDPIERHSELHRRDTASGVSLGLVDGNQPALGIVELPFLNTRYEAVRGGTRPTGGRRLGVACIASIDHAVALQLPTSYGQQRSNVTACVILSNKPWDRMASVLIAREAGALVLNIHGMQHIVSSASTVAVPPQVAAELLTPFQPAGEERS
jgi:myo-inositol-1(or 4)-monophosphatase